MKAPAAAVLAFALLFIGRPAARTADSLSDALDAYAQGRFDEAVAAAARVKDAKATGEALASEAPAWIARVPADADRRRLAVATFVLEFTHARMAADWGALAPLIEWACLMLRTAGPPSDAEHRWHLAVIALAGRAGDHGRLGATPAWAAGSIGRLDLETLKKNAAKSGHLAHALGRFPDEPRILLATASVVAMRGAAMESPRAYREGVLDVRPVFQQELLKSALTCLEPLRPDPSLAAIVLVREGHILYAMGDFPRALLLERAARQSASESATAYLAHFLAGRVLLAMKRPDEAAGQFEAALRLRPRAQSAALALAGIRATAPASSAIDLIRPALASQDVFDDPWRLYAYGDYMYLPDLIHSLRASIQ